MRNVVRHAPLAFFVLVASSPLVLGGCAPVVEERHEADALNAALPTALTALDGAHKGQGPYRLIGARQMVREGAWVWHFTFKAEQHLPADPSRQMLTAGGEIFVTVPREPDAAEVRYGE